MTRSSSTSTRPPALRDNTSRTRPRTSRRTSRTTTGCSCDTTGPTSPAGTRPTGRTGPRPDARVAAAGECADRSVRLRQHGDDRGAGGGVRLVPHHGGPGAPSGPSFDDEFDGSTLDTARWNASVRAEPERGRERWPADDHDGAGRHLHRRHRLRRRTTSSSSLRPTPAGLDDRDEGVRHDQRRVRPGRPDRVLERRQLRQARPDLRRRLDRGSTASSCGPRSAARRSTRGRRPTRRCRPARPTSGCG